MRLGKHYNFLFPEDSQRMEMVTAFFTVSWHAPDKHYFMNKCTRKVVYFMRNGKTRIHCDMDSDIKSFLIRLFALFY